MERHVFTKKEEVKGGKDSHMHHKKMALHHNTEMKKHINDLAKMAKVKMSEKKK